MEYSSRSGTNLRKPRPFSVEQAPKPRPRKTELRASSDQASRLADHALVVPADFASEDVADAMVDARGKEITHEHPESVKASLGVRPIDIAKAMLVDEIPEDVRYLVELIRDLCEP